MLQRLSGHRWRAPQERVVMNKIKSIWDGWGKQLFGELFDGKGGFCAIGWYDANARHLSVPPEVVERVASAIRKQYVLPTGRCSDMYGNSLYPSHDGFHAVIYANNVLRLKPEEFRKIDRESQIGAAVRPLVDSDDMLPEFLEAGIPVWNM